MSIIERVQAVADTLTPAEQKLVKEIIATPREVALGTASRLAQRIGVHEATASRLAKKLGFGSYAGFRDAIRDEFIGASEPAQRVLTTLETADGGDLLADMVAREIEALSAVPRYVDAARLAAAAAVLNGARRVFVFARGNAETLTIQVRRRLMRMGRDVHALSGDGRDLAEQVLDLSDDDAVLAFAFRRPPRHYAPLLERARAVGAKSVVIAGTVGASLRPAPDILLSAPRSGSSLGFQTLTVPMTIANALVLTMAQQDRPGALEKLELLGQLIASFDR